MNSSHKVILFKENNLTGEALVLFAATDLHTIPGWIGNIQSVHVLAGSWFVKQPGKTEVAFQGSLMASNNYQLADVFSPPFEKIAPYGNNTNPARSTEPNRTVTTPQTYHLFFYPAQNAFSINPAPPHQFKIVDAQESFRWLINDGDTLIINWDGEIGHPWLEFRQRTLKPGEAIPASAPVEPTNDIIIDNASNPMRVTLQHKDCALTVDYRNGVKWSIDFCWNGGKIDPEMQVGTGSGNP